MIINNNMDDSGQLQTQWLEYVRSIESKKPCLPWFNRSIRTSEGGGSSTAFSSAWVTLHLVLDSRRSAFIPDFFGANSRPAKAALTSAMSARL
jgi:hypothetical protein